MRVENSISRVKCYKGYADDMLMITGQTGLFQALNTTHPNIKLAVKRGVCDIVSFLDIQLTPQYDGVFHRCRNAIQ
ncbi:hypothetical protein T265_10103 [Opisthorchis viverrini]|uniref:Uncharacterized protein n=1 Tax=Opisthorchis viverrini TaxID=6198 RepID=A0A074Z3K3_OPIVI|nr:hypothetical protein T265_10103 [Opisthorchis viverrini]KER21608.1 hypothetical protein T265_10103 [Opisthorchis viverrini]